MENCVRSAMGAPCESETPRCELGIAETQTSVGTPKRVSTTGVRVDGSLVNGAQGTRIACEIPLCLMPVWHTVALAAAAAAAHAVNLPGVDSKDMLIKGRILSAVSFGGVHRKTILSASCASSNGPARHHAAGPP
ncbi:hypothetical protein TW95_gp1724 [Pandoravirus inopinatum]|uniref:Uncharacterized protein n=1 Tax=Pandoravirus inopinatum TaxID=1605721 RepID=A0A0B5IZS7_9VIRU|nr:hypothetical protein TW95_gp1724 [Pandoravirus inopinatum]AJF98458.1 hypothetical protein [Pandoravirus inopinatum]